MRSKSSRRSDPRSFRGRWRIVSTNVCRPKELDDFAPAHISFGKSNHGELSLLAISADVDYRVGVRDGEPVVEFSWEGDDDGNPICGRGWARRDAQELVGRLFIHGGDEAEFAQDVLA
jgi:hypothetical protein